MATIQEIAKRAGTSVATVSHVINRTRFVSDELRGRVERAMEELGAPKQERRKITVGFLLRNYRCSFAEDLIDALHCCGDIHNREELSHRVVGPGDIEVVSILVKTEMTLQELKTYQKRYGLDYIILDYTVRLVQTRYHETVEAPIIFLNHDPKVYPRCYHINFDYRAAMVAALRHMVSLGHRNILVITPKENPYTNRLVLETCKLFYKQNHMVFPDENLVEIETYLFRTLALENLDQVLGTLQSRGITGIITTEMMATMHVVDYLQHQGVTMPQDISLLAIGDIFLTKYLFFNRTRIDMRIIEVVQDIIKIIKGDGGQRFFSISPEFITGDSTKALVFDQFDRPGASQLSLELSEADIQKVRAGDYKVCVSTYMETTPVSHSKLEGLRDGLNTLGIHLVQKTETYPLTQEMRRTISMASVLHDIGKMEIGEQVLNSPEPRTPEDEETMRQHTLLGARMLEELDAYRDEDFVRVAYQICRWHHERYDGSGYPDQLVGEQIPIAAQVVGLADAYETLTTGSGSQPPVPCAAAVQMLCTGEAGAFNPVLLDCLREIENEIDDAMRRRPETL